MDVETNKAFLVSPTVSRLAREEGGQSVLEFLIMLPMMVALTVILVKVNTAIQMSIVDQQYARAQALWLTFNSSVYPRLQSRELNFVPRAFNQMVIGVSDNVAPEAGKYTPKASVQNVSRKRSPGGDQPQYEPDENGQRALVRVRNTVALCTQPNVVNVGTHPEPILPLQNVGTPQNPDFRAAGRSNLSDGSRFEYCRSPLK